MKKGQTILIHAGAGGVGGYAIQLAKEIGATIFTTASQKNHEYVRDLGADFPIDYTKENFADVIRSKFREGIDVVLDAMGGEIQASWSTSPPTMV